jgi:hypothetical protein
MRFILQNWQLLEQILEQAQKLAVMLLALRLSLVL